MTDLQTLIARLEAASEKDTATLDRLSYAIGKALGEEHPWRAYTTSVDAALTLVPEGCFVTIDKYLVSDESADLWRVWIKWLPNEEAARLDHVFSGVRTAPALALCIAALKAREAT